MKRAAVLVLGFLLAGCTNAGPSTEASTGCSSASPTATAVTAAVRDGRAEPAPHRVKIPLHGPVVLRVSTDRDAEVHVHGYELTEEVPAGRTGCLSFVADRAGLFDVEAHPDTLLVQLEVR